MERAEIERMREFIDTAKQPGDLPWARIECDVADWLAQHGAELLRLALLGKRVEDAPVVEVGEATPITVAIAFRRGQRVALVGVE